MSPKSHQKLSKFLSGQGSTQCKPQSIKAIPTLIFILFNVLAIKGVMGLDVHMGVSDFGLLGKEAWFFCNYSDNGESIIGLEWFFSPDPSDLGTAIMSYDPYNHDVQVSRNWERRIQFPDRSSNTSFTISPLERGDQGVYRCTVVGDDTVTKEKYLEVYDPPDEKDGLKVVEDFRPIAIGETQVYTCQSSNSSPPATLMWYINDTPIPNEHILLNKPITDPNTGLSTSVMKIKIVGSPDMEGAKLACRATFPRQPMKEWVRVIKVTKGNGRTRNTIIHPIFFVTTPMMTASTSETSMSAQKDMIMSTANITLSAIMDNTTMMNKDVTMNAILKSDGHMMMTDHMNMSLMDKVSMFMTTPLSNLSASSHMNHTDESLMSHMVVTSDSMITVAEVINVTGMSETTIIMNQSADHMIMHAENSSIISENILHADHSAGTVSVLESNMSMVQVPGTMVNQSSRMKIDDINQMLMSTTLSPGATAPVRNDMGKVAETKKNAASIITGQYVIFSSSLVLIAARFF